MPGRDVVAEPGFICEVGPRHPQRSEDVLAHVILVALSRHATDELAQRDVAEIGVPHAAIRPALGVAMADQKISRELPRVKLAIACRMHPPQRERIWQTRGMTQEVSNGHGSTGPGR